MTHSSRPARATIRGHRCPARSGNAAIAGHRTTYLHPFYNLNELVPGDPITIVTLQGIFLYHVTGSLAVPPTDVSVVDQTRTPTLTLTTCNPRYSASQRLVVHARLVASILNHPKTADVSTVPVAPVRNASPNPPHDWTAAILWGIAVAALTTWSGPGNGVCTGADGLPLSPSAWSPGWWWSSSSSRCWRRCYRRAIEPRS